MAKFRPRNDDELSRLEDEKLLEYIAAAYADGSVNAAQRGLAIIVFRYDSLVVARCRLKVPPADAEDVAQEVIVSAIRSRLAGKSIGEFRVWLNQIISRRIADYHRKPGLDTTELPEEHEEDDRIWGQAGQVKDETGALEVREIAKIALSEVSPQHQRVIVLFVFGKRSAADVCKLVNPEFPNEKTMKADNVSKIAERYRRRVRELLEAAELEPDEEDPDNRT